MENDQTGLFEENFEKTRTYLKEAKQLCSGIFWFLSDSYELSDYRFLKFDVPCDPYGNPLDLPSVRLNSKKGNSYNHKKIWEEEVKNNNEYRPYNRKDYNYYPRGRVVISHYKADIWINQNLNEPRFIDVIKQEFGLFIQNIHEININIDGSDHYKCFLDWK